MGAEDRRVCTVAAALLVPSADSQVPLATSPKAVRVSVCYALKPHAMHGCLGQELAWRYFVGARQKGKWPGTFSTARDARVLALPAGQPLPDWPPPRPPSEDQQVATEAQVEQLRQEEEQKGRRRREAEEEEGARRAQKGPRNSAGEAGGERSEGADGREPKRTRGAGGQHRGGSAAGA